MTTINEAFKALMPDAVGFRTRYRSEPKMIGHYPWTYSDARRRLYDRPACDYEDLYTADQMRQMFDAATERAAKQGRSDGVLIAAYALPVAPGIIEQVRIERARQMFGPDLWAIRKNGNVLNKEGEWEWEPMPSSRDDEFLARARFATAEQAIAAAIRAGGEKT